jgi:hypothetical protein
MVFKRQFHALLPSFEGRDEALIMQRLMALIALGLTALTLGGGILAAARLLSLGEMRPVIAGMCLVLAGRLATELAAQPARLLRRRTAATRRILPALLAQGWIFLAMSAWAGCALLLYRWSPGIDDAPLLLWCYAVAVSPWLLFERRHFVRDGTYFLCSTPPSPLLFFEIACAAAAAQLLLGSSPQLVAVSFAAIMGVSFLFECAEMLFPTRIHQIWVAARSPAAPLRSNPWAAAALVIGATALFAVDVATPAGIDDGAGYSPLLILCLWLAGRRTLVTATWAMSLLVVTAFFLVQSTEIGLVGTLFNRGMSVASIWIVYFFLSRRSLLAAALRAAEGRVPAV